MMRRLIVVALGIVVALSVATPASATTGISAIVGALQKAPVYVEQGTEGTTADTAPTLTDTLHQDDNIALVMLPAASELTQDDVNTLAQKISNGLKGKRIVGIAVGTQFAGAASIMPSGTADDLMNRAETVSTNPAETLVTFVRNVHDWQTSNPDYLPTPKPAKVKASAPTWLFVVGGIFLALIVMFVMFFSTRWHHRIRTRVHYNAPGNLNDPVKKMMEFREHLQKADIYWDDYTPKVNGDRKESVARMCSAINLVCRYTETYFRMFAEKKKDPETIQLFSGQLDYAKQVVEKYVFVYENHEYVDDPLGLMKIGHESIEGYSAAIMSSIRKGNNNVLMEYKVNTGILDAQRYKNPKSPR